MADERQKIPFTGVEKIHGDLPLQIKEKFERAVVKGFQEEFDREIVFEWAFNEGAVYISREVLDIWEEPDDLLYWIEGIFKDSVEEVEVILDAAGEAEAADGLRETYLDEWDKDPPL